MAERADTTTTATDTASNVAGAAVSADSDPAETVEQVHFSLLYSAIYHDMMDRRLTAFGRWSQFAQIVSGSAAAVSVTSIYPEIAVVFALLVAAIGALSLVLDFGGGAAGHRALKRVFYGLLADLEAGDDLGRVKLARARAYADEPPEDTPTTHRAHNRAGASLYGDDFVKV